MGSIAKVLQPFRIIALPLTKASQTSEALIYYHFQLTKPVTPPPRKRDSHVWSPEGGWLNWASAKASQTWTSYGKAEQGSWKNRVYRAGERIVDRIDFEELSLKSIDPSLGPTVRHPDFSGRVKDVLKDNPTLKIPLLYPSSIQSGHAIVSHLMSLVRHRGPKHRKGFFVWMSLAPFTAPLKLIPIIPNLPFFFCVWRSWHHYRAYRASQYVEALLESDTIQPEASAILDPLYKLYDPASGAHLEESGPRPLLTHDAVPALLRTLSLNAEDGLNIRRALVQTQSRMQERHADI